MGARRRYEEAAAAGVEWLAAQLNDDGSYGQGVNDLACYYKSPYLFHLSGRAREASRLLTFIDLRFGREDHDFATSADQKSDNAAFNEYWAYPNGWIAMAAQRMGRFDIAYPAFKYLLSLHRPDMGGFLTNRPQGRGEEGTDVFTTAHLGLVCLYFGDIQRASAAGRFVARVLAMQRETLSDGFLLRLDRRGNLVRDIPEAAAAFHVVRVEEPDQAYFMIGYPMAFLAKLFQATGDVAHLEAARDYLDFALSCGGNLRTFYFSHKVAWGAAALARIMGDQRCVELATAIADHLLEIQDPSGAWLTDQPAHTCSIKPRRSPSGSRRSAPSWRAQSSLAEGLDLFAEELLASRRRPVYTVYDLGPLRVPSILMERVRHHQLSGDRRLARGILVATPQKGQFAIAGLLALRRVHGDFRLQRGYPFIYPLACVRAHPLRE